MFKLPFTFFRSRPEKEPMRPRTLLLLFLFLFANIFYMSQQSQNTGGVTSGRAYNCELGPFTQVGKCTRDSQYNDKGEFVWSYTHTTGPLDMKYCDQMSLDADELKISNPAPRPEVILRKTDCKALNLDNNHFCYSSQRVITQDKKRITNVLVTDAHCAMPQYFEGINILFITGRPIGKQQDWHTPYEGIPEITP